eukprot:NODE_763_length_4425_cov_0.192094.p2 type:complete len:217 gc:universal NODE_763_length_4425_cov_0.192094:3979-3329(-)
MFLILITNSVRTCFYNDYFCIDAYISNNRVYTIIDAPDHHEYTAFGFGFAMSDSDIVSFSKVNNTIVVQPRKSVYWHALPPVIVNFDLIVHSIDIVYGRRYLNTSRSLNGVQGFTVDLQEGLNSFIWCHGRLDENGDLLKHDYRSNVYQGLNLVDLGERTDLDSSIAMSTTRENTVYSASVVIAKELQTIDAQISTFSDNRKFIRVFGLLLMMTLL